MVWEIISVTGSILTIIGAVIAAIRAIYHLKLRYKKRESMTNFKYQQGYDLVRNLRAAMAEMVIATQNLRPLLDTITDDEEKRWVDRLTDFYEKDRVFGVQFGVYKPFITEELVEKFEKVQELCSSEAIDYEVFGRPSMIESGEGRGSRKYCESQRQFTRELHIALDSLNSETKKFWEGMDVG